MEILKISLEIILGLAIIIASGNFLVNNAIYLSKATNIPEVMIGATVVSLATTLPELSVTIFSSIENANSLAVGNAIGSMVFNLTIIIGICIMFLPQKIDSKSISKNFIFLFLCLVLLFFLGSFNCMNYFYGVILLLMCVYYLLENFIDARRRVVAEKVIIEKVNFSKKQVTISTVKLITCSLFVLIGAKILINGCIDIAHKMNISHHIIGVSIVAIGTSLPELVTAISAIRKKSTSIAIGNIIGANILSCTLLMGASGVLNKGVLVFDKNITFIAIPLCILSLFILFLPIIRHNSTKRYQGILLFLISIIYYFFLFKNI